MKFSKKLFFSFFSIGDLTRSKINQGRMETALNCYEYHVSIGTALNYAIRLSLEGAELDMKTKILKKTISFISNLHPNDRDTLNTRNLLMRKNKALDDYSCSQLFCYDTAKERELEYSEFFG
ncbi:hypothetical protein ACJX0J_039135, partial [Zea mays]